MPQIFVALLQYNGDWYELIKNRACIVSVYYYGYVGSPLSVLE